MIQYSSRRGAALSPPALVLLASFYLCGPMQAGEPAAGGVAVEIIEGIPAERSWKFLDEELPGPAARYREEAFAFPEVPRKYTASGVIADRSNPFLLRASARLELPAGEYRFLLRSRGAARLHVDGRLLLETDFTVPNSDGHDPVPEAPAAIEPGLRPLPPGHQERLVRIGLEGPAHEFRLEAIVGGKNLRAETAELSVSAARDGEPLRLLGPGAAASLDDAGWEAYAARARERIRALDAAERRAAAASEDEYWSRRRELARAEAAKLPPLAIPEVSDKYFGTGSPIDRYIGRRLEEAGVEPAPLAEDWAFLRRATLDVAGVPPSAEEVEEFLADERPDKRARAIDRLLADRRWADNWVGYWQDVLAENPGILKPTLNNTGPFRWWIRESFADNKPIDRLVTELVMMEGSKLGGGPAGFGMASQNDSPMAAKAHILAQAFLGVELACARCHDAPSHPYRQKDLFSLAAMLGRGPLEVPPTSSIPPGERERRTLVEVTLEPGTKVEPAWPFGTLAPADLPEGILRREDDPRERLAAVLTSPRNRRFAEVIANRLWKRYLGWGLVEPVDDWHRAAPSHPELLDHLARELMASGYDLKALSRRILESHAYQRAVRPAPAKAPRPAERLFAAAARRRMTAEQLVDSLFVGAGKEFGSEELNLDVDGRRPITQFINLGVPECAWEFTSLSNERDRPALSLPAAQGIADLLSAHGWRESRQNPLTVREEETTPLQVLALAHGAAGSRIATLSENAAITALCLEDRPLRDLVRAVHVRLLSRPPAAEEEAMFIELLEEGYKDRRVEAPPEERRREPGQVASVSWSNHLSPEATRLKLELERLARAGDPPTRRLRPEWRERMEDLVWCLVNSPEFIFLP